jgi:hypothetical protein
LRGKEVTEEGGLAKKKKNKEQRVEWRETEKKRKGKKQGD